MPSACRWGILGTANIARKNWKAMRVAGNSTLTAVASRDAARAKRFIDECQSEVAFSQSPVACGSYEELLKLSNVDAVYIPLPTGIRREWVVKAAQAGKHILCEKPCGTNAADLRAMLDACKANKVQFMDGVMFMHSARLPLLRSVLDDGESVGTLRRIASQFCFQATGDFMEKNIRVASDLEPLGVLGDLGWYNIRFTLWVMKYQMPERVSGRTLHEHGSARAPCRSSSRANSSSPAASVHRSTARSARRISSGRTSAVRRARRRSTISCSPSTARKPRSR